MKFKRKDIISQGRMQQLLGGVVIAFALVALFTYLRLAPYLSRSSDTSAISGTYDCSGTEEGTGMSAGAGTLTIQADGNFRLEGIYSTYTSGKLYWLNPSNLATTEASDFDTINVSGQESLTIMLKAGVRYAHAQTGYMSCTLQRGA